MHRSEIFLLPLIGVICVSITQPLSAQTSSLFGTRGALNQTGSASATTRASGSTVAGGTVGIGGQSALNLDAGTGGVSTDFGTGFVGRSDNSGRFTGNQLAPQGGTSQTRNFGASGFGGRGSNRSGGFGGRGGASQFGSNSRIRVFRPRQRIAFAYTKRPTSVINNSLHVRFDRLTVSRELFQGVTFQLAEGKVTLRGEVDTETARKLAASLVRMEPGVRSVSNELVVKLTPSAADAGSSE